MELGKIGCFNIRSVLNNQQTWENMTKFTFSDGICLLCAFMCDKRRRHFKHHWTFETKSDLISLGIWCKQTNHPFRNQSNSIHDAIFYCVLHVHTPSCPNMVFLVVNQKFRFLVCRDCFFVEWGCSFVHVSS